jgi:hypothetical protein
LQTGNILQGFTSKSLQRDTLFMVVKDRLCASRGKKRENKYKKHEV